MNKYQGENEANIGSGIEGESHSAENVTIQMELNEVAELINFIYQEGELAAQF